MKHLWAKLACKPREWRRIFKALSCMDYLIKNGAPRVIQDVKDDMFKIRTLESFSYNEEGSEKGQGGKYFTVVLIAVKNDLVRDKAKEVCELLNDGEKLSAEREFATNTRNKLQGGSTGYNNN